MGVAGAIGAALANRCKPVLCITGDSGLSMSLQDLLTHKAYDLPIITILLDNQGYLTMKHTMQSTFSRLSGCQSSDGIINPEYPSLLKSYGIKYEFTNNLADFKNIINRIHKSDPMKPHFVHVAMNPRQALVLRLQTVVTKSKKKYLIH